MADSGRTVYGASALNGMTSSVTFELIPESQPFVWLDEEVDGNGNWLGDILDIDFGCTLNVGNAFTIAPPRVTSNDPLFTFAQDGLYLNYLYLFFAPTTSTETRAIADALLYDNQWFSLNTSRPSALQNICTTWMAPQSEGDEQQTITVSNYIGPNKIDLWTATFTSIKIG